MTERRPDEHRNDPELDAFVAEAIGALDRDMGSRAVARSFGDVLARAHRLDPERVPASALDEERRSRQVIELRPHRESAEVAMSERALDDLITDARIALETEIAEERPVSTRLRPPMPRHGRGRWIGLGAGLAVAAALVLVAINVTTSTLQRRTEPRNQAFSISDVEQKAEQSLSRRPARLQRSHRPQSRASARSRSLPLHPRCTTDFASSMTRRRSCGGRARSMLQSAPSNSSSIWRREIATPSLRTPICSPLHTARATPSARASCGASTSAGSLRVAMPTTRARGSAARHRTTPGRPAGPSTCARCRADPIGRKRAGSSESAKTTSNDRSSPAGSSEPGRLHGLQRARLHRG
jgi:hypothetical protein